MGYELDAAAPSLLLEVEADHQQAWLERRWRLANERLAHALDRYASLRGAAAPGEPAWLAAQLRVAEARRRCREVADEVERFAGAGNDADYRR